MHYILHTPLYHSKTPRLPSVTQTTRLTKLSSPWCLEYSDFYQQYQVEFRPRLGLNTPGLWDNGTLHQEFFRQLQSHDTFRHTSS